MCFPEVLEGFSYHLIPIINHQNPDSLKNSKLFLKEFISIFCIDRTKLKENILTLATETNGGFTLRDIQDMYYFDYEEYIEIFNNRAKKKQESTEEQNQNTHKLPNTNNLLNKISSISKNKF